MLKRPNPYRKTRAAGTLDDLMFDMDKRRHTSFRFQNYQNFITDRPGKFVSCARVLRVKKDVVVIIRTGRLYELAGGGVLPLLLGPSLGRCGVAVLWSFAAGMLVWGIEHTSTIVSISDQISRVCVRTLFSPLPVPVVVGRTHSSLLRIGPATAVADRQIRA